MKNASIARPRDWYRDLWNLDPDNEDNNGLQNEDLIVWMRTAALPNFRKLYRRLDRNVAEFKDGLPKGNYTLEIEYSKNYLKKKTYPVIFNCSKWKFRIPKLVGSGIKFLFRRS